MTDQFWIGPNAAPDTYRLVSLLGGGGEGEVWQGVLPLSAEGRRSVAVKIMPAVSDPDESQRLERFGHLLRSLNHPGLVRVTDVFIGPGMHRAGEPGRGTFVYVVMDYVEGLSLREWVAENPEAPASQRLRMLRMIASALDVMHSGAATEVPVAHGDVKPANIVVRPDGGTVLVDLGLARLADGTGVAGHSAPYGAPELRVRGALPTPDADRYAFAVTIAQALTGQPPPLGPDGWLDTGALADMLAMHPATARRHLLVRQIMAVLAAPPEARPRELRPWLDGAVDSLSQVTAGDTLPVAPTVPMTDRSLQATPVRNPGAPTAAPSEAPRRRQRRTRMVLIGAVLVVGVVGGLVALNLGLPSAGITGPSAAGPVSTTEPTAPPSGSASTAGASAQYTPTTPRSASASTTLAPTPYLTQMRVVEYNRQAHAGGYDVRAAAISGETYPRAITMTAGRYCGNDDGGTYWIDYSIGRSWTTFTTTVGLTDESSADSDVTYTVLGDEKVLASGPLKLGDAVPIEVPVSGVLRLRLQMQNPASADGQICQSTAGAAVAWGEPTLS